MLLLHQVGTVKIGEVVRYTVTYTPSHDRILPSPESLVLRIRNSSTIALRAAFVHGPYTLSVAAYPATFRPDEKFASPRRYGVPEFEPLLKAGGTWTVRLLVPDDIRQGAGDGVASGGHFGGGPELQGRSVSWIVEVASQVIFSTSAAVGYEVLLARDEKSLSTGAAVPVLGGTAQVPQPGRVSDYQRGRDGRHPDQPKGVFSKAVRLKVEDTAALWNTPQLPGWDDLGKIKQTESRGEVAIVPAAAAATDSATGQPPKKPKKLHLVVLTHGLHSNLGADLLFLKESIDAGVRQANVDRKTRKAREKAERRKARGTTPPPPPSGLGVENTDKASASATPPEDDAPDSDDEEDEEVIVRGFSGNAARTERGIKYLGKRLARYVLSMTYPDQPFLPAAKATSEMVTGVLHGGLTRQDAGEGKPVHKHSTIHQTPSEGQRAYKITKISFIGHSLGGLVQTYGIAYIQKHSPQFFDIIKPINFVALASPFLGLNHENPLYVKFALDFGLVGRTGQDLGLTWRAPTIARSGWGAIVSNLGENAHKKVLGETQPESKPLLRILPTGPAHTALKKFRNRTVYSNVVNDGIVPLRTSCLLFLDWQGLGRVDKARRETGLVETLVGAGWAELTGANVTSPRIGPWEPQQDDDDSTSTGVNTPSGHHDAHEVPQPSSDALLEDDRQSLRAVATPYQDEGYGNSQLTATTNNANPFTGFFNLFRSNERPKSPPPPSVKQNKIYQRSQTLKVEDASAASSAASSRSRVTSGTELLEEAEGVMAPPRTSFFESATDLINPKLPSVEYLIDPSKRPRTIFHDRVYHPSDIPPPPLKKRPGSSIGRRRRSIHRSPSSGVVPKITTSASAGSGQSTASSPYASPGGISHEDSMASTRDYDDTAHTNPDKEPDEVIDSSNMRVEEKIARAYHRDLSWRKVLVKLEPDAHNNLIVRRMFANAFGWPVIQHLVDAHFSDAAAARMRDESETNAERARSLSEAPDEHGRETTAQTDGAGAAGAGGDEASPAPGREDSAQSQDTKFSLARTDSEALEARDEVPELPASPRPEDKMLGGAPGRPPFDRLDSADWSDRDWADSELDSDGDEDNHHLAYGAASGGVGLRAATATAAGHGKKDLVSSEADADAPSPVAPPERTSSPLAEWWAEKIVGRGSTSKAKAPKSPQEGSFRRQDEDVD